MTESSIAHAVQDHEHNLPAFLEQRTHDPVQNTVGAEHAGRAVMQRRFVAPNIPLREDRVQFITPAPVLLQQLLDGPTKVASLLLALHQLQRQQVQPSTLLSVPNSPIGDAGQGLD